MSLKYTLYLKTLKLKDYRTKKCAVSRTFKCVVGQTAALLGQEKNNHLLNDGG